MNTFTDTDLTVLEGLDEAWTCDPPAHFGDCSAPAEWLIVSSSDCCTTERLMCSEHKAEYLADLHAKADWACGRCDRDYGEGIGTDFFSIDRIEAL